MAGLWIVIIGLGLGALCAVIVAVALGQASVRPAASPLRRRVTFAALLLTSALALNGAMELGGDLLPALLLVACAAALVQAARIALAAHRAGQSLVAYVVIAIVVGTLEIAAEGSNLRWALVGDPANELGEEEADDESWRIEDSMPVDEGAENETSAL